MITFTIVESPYRVADGTPRAEVELARNLAYVRAAMRDCFHRKEIPIPSHALYTQPGVLDDAAPDERALGIGAGKLIAQFLGAARSYAKIPGLVVVRHAFYIDRGESSGMRDARPWSREFPGLNAPEDRRLGEWWGKEHDHLWALTVNGVLYSPGAPPTSAMFD